MVRARHGKSTLGCLLQLLIVAAILYFGEHVGETYWRYYQFKDAMKEEIRFRSHLPIPDIKAHMKLVADSLNLPEDAGKVTVHREGREIIIESDYEEPVEMPGLKRDIHFHPRVVGGVGST